MFWYGAVVLLRKSALVAIGIVASGEPSIAAYLATIVFMTGIVANLALQPHRKNWGPAYPQSADDGTAASGTGSTIGQSSIYATVHTVLNRIGGGMSIDTCALVANLVTVASGPSFATVPHTSGLGITLTTLVLAVNIPPFLLLLLTIIGALARAWAAIRGKINRGGRSNNRSKPIGIGDGEEKGRVEPPAPMIPTSDDDVGIEMQDISSAYRKEGEHDHDDNNIGDNNNDHKVDYANIRVSVDNVVDDDQNDKVVGDKITSL